MIILASAFRAAARTRSDAQTHTSSAHSEGAPDLRAPAGSLQSYTVLRARACPNIALASGAPAGRRIREHALAIDFQPRLEINYVTQF